MRILKEYSVNKGDGSLDAKIYREIACTSGEMAGIDTSKLADGSRLTATDTGASYVFNESAKTWTQESSGGGGSGGGVLVVHVVRTTTDEAETYTLDKTWQELADALNSGKSLSFVQWDSNENVGHSYDNWGIMYLMVSLASNDGNLPLETDSPDGYPTVTIPF